MMETVGVAKQQPYSPHLKKVLKTYQLSAVKSLQGPSTLLGMDKGVVMPATASANSAGTTTVTLVPKKEHHLQAESVKVAGASPPPALQPPPPPPPAECTDVFMTPPPFPIQQLPILTTPDQSRSELSETVLEGETISCFVVGGEKRLCLPQVLNSVLREFSLYQINQVCEELQIFCSRCNPEQLQVLKASGILPMTAPSCGLITKTDAERLSSALLHHRNAVAAPVVKASRAKTGAFSFKVYHECFGKCKGICTPELYTDKNAHCIECLECHVMFSPQKFVCHVHRFRETRTCHWGFDSNNWRSYLLLAKDQDGHEKLAKVLDEFKEQHDNVGAQHKRKQAHNPVIDAKDSQKKPKLEGGDPYGTYIYPVTENSPILWYEPWARMSAFRPWSTLSNKEGKVPSLRESSLPPTTVPAYLSHSPPVLLHPERVVPMSESERFERSFQPNVALAPIHTPHRSRLEAMKTEVKTEDLRIEEQEEKPLCSKKSPTLVPEAHHVTACSPPGRTANLPLQEPQHCTINYNPEIELSTDTDDSSSDIIGETGDSVVEQVVEVLDGLTDAKEVTRARIVELVQRLARKLEEGSIRARHMRSENTDLQRVCREQERRIREQEERIIELEQRLQQNHESPIKKDPDAFQDKVAAMEKELHILRNEVAGMPCSSLGHRVKEPSGGSPVSVITSPPPVIKMEPACSE